MPAEASGAHAIVDVGLGPGRSAGVVEGRWVASPLQREVEMEAHPGALC